MNENLKVEKINIPAIRPAENEPENEIKIPKVSLEGVNPAADEPEKKYIIPLDGRWIPGEDPVVIGKNFVNMQNMRYAGAHPEGILGMTKINSAAVMDATYYKARSAFHFAKASPAESHFLVQAYNDLKTAAQLLDNTTAIPSVGSFAATELHTDTAGAGLAQFSDAPDGQMTYCNGVDSLIWAGQEGRVAAFITSTAAVTTGSATSPVDFTDKVNNTKVDAANVASITATSRVWLVGTTRPIKGLKYYIATPNATAATMTGTYFDGSTWTALTLGDNTAAGGASLAVTGTVTFTVSTVGLAKPRYLEGYYLFWYQFVIDDGTATISHVTIDAPIQPVVDIWDGVFRSVGRCYKMTTVYTDNTTNVLNEDYVSTTATTYCDVDDFLAFSDPNYCLEIGFTEKQTALMIVMCSGYNNAVADTTAAVDYWDGAAYTTVGTIVDGTSEGAISLAKTGVISWNNNSLSAETKKVVSNSPALYYYRLRFDKEFAPTRIDYIGGIPSYRTLSGYSFGIHAADRLMLGCDNYERKNRLIISAEGKPDVLNGTDYFEIDFGDDKALTCGTSIFAQYASSIYNIAIILKASEMWSLVWTESSTGTEWNRYRVSPNVGCPAPRTLKVVSAAFENNLNQVKSIAIWRADDGIYISNGQSPLKVSGDIDKIFDPAYPGHVCQAMIRYENAFIDKHNMEYHWLYATDWYSISFTSGAHEPTVGETITGNTSGATGVVDCVTVVSGAWSGTAAGVIYMRDITGTWASGETIKQGATTVGTSSSVAALAPTLNYLNKEAVLDLKTWKWYPIDRYDTNLTITNRLQCGAEVVDTSGNYYTYGLNDAGYCYRLEYGTTFDAQDITHILETGEQLLEQNDLLSLTRVCRICLIALARNTDSTVLLEHTIDGATTNTDYSISIADATHRYANVVTPMWSKPGIFHAFKMTMTTDDETKGFVPIFIPLYYKKERDNI